MRISVIIPTTDGPSQILRLTALENAPRSVMRTQDDYRPLPVSSAYQAFASQSGPMDIAFGLESGAFDLRLSDRIDAGRSWELPVALAHWLQAQGHEIGTDAPELVLWATGALDLDMAVIAQDYHLETKLSGSLCLLQALAEKETTCVVVLLPGATSLPDDLPDSIDVHHVDSFFAASQILLPTTTMENEMPGKPVRSRARWPIWGGLGAVSVLSAIVLATAFLPAQISQSSDTVAQVGADKEQGMDFDLILVDDDTTVAVADTSPDPEHGIENEAKEASLPPEPPDDALALAPVLVLLRPQDNDSCVDVHFGNSEARRERLEATAESFQKSDITELCAIGFELPEHAPRSLTVALPEALVPHVTRSDRLTEFDLSPGDERLMRLTANLPASLELRWRFTEGDGNSFELQHSLSSAH